MKLLQTLCRMLSAALLPISRNGIFFFFMYVLGIVCAYGIVPDRPWCHVYSNIWTELFFDLYTICLVLALIPRKVRPWLRGIFAFAAYATAMVDLYCFVKFDSPLNPTMLLLVGETNSNEASEFLASYLSADLLFSRVGIVFLLAVLHTVIGVYHKKIAAAATTLLGRCQKLNSIVCHQSENIDCLKELLRPVAGTAIATTFAICAIISWENKQLLVRLMSYDNIGEVEHELTKHPHGEQYLPLYRLAFSVYANELTAKQLVRLKAGLNDIKVDSCSFRSRNIVLIIGESYNRNHSALYGYDIANTPKQKRLYKRGELIPFTDVVSPWNLTSFVFKHLFSLYAVGDKGDWCDYPLFPELFRKAGYHVTFMTNQFLPQAKEAVYDFSGGFFLNDEELSKAQFDTRNTQLYRFDNGLLCDYDKLKDQGKDKPQLIIFHLKGQHVDYRSRCPKNQKKFNKDTYKELRTDLSPKERRILSDYDNATLYNDSIVNAIIDRFRSDDAIVIYVPDHGEEVYDGAHFYGRMHSTEVTPRLAHAEFEIPMWIWASKKYRQTHRDIWQKVKKNRKLPYMTDALPHLLLNLAGIHCPTYRGDLDILSDSYNPSRPRILKRQADYDKLMEEERLENESKSKSAASATRKGREHKPLRIDIR